MNPEEVQNTTRHLESRNRYKKCFSPSWMACEESKEKTYEKEKDPESVVKDT